MSKSKTKIKLSPKTRFTLESIPFLKKAGRQKNPTWLERNQEEYEQHLKEPLTHLAHTVASKLRPLAPDYHFPKMGLGRIKRTASSIAENGALYKDWLTYTASKPRQSRFEHNPSLFFMINSEDKEDPVLVAGGLYMPSSRQTRAMRETLAEDASAFEALFKSKEFKSRFPGGFSDEKISSRPARGFNPDHPRMSLLRLQAFFVWRSYSMKDFTSTHFATLVASDFKQILRLNRLIEASLEGRLQTVQQEFDAEPVALLERLKDFTPVRHKEDF